MKDAPTSRPCAKVNVGSFHCSTIPNRSQMEVISVLFPEIHKYAWQLINDEIKLSKTFLSFCLLDLNIEFLLLLQPITRQQSRSVAGLTGCVFFRVTRTSPLQLLRWPTRSPSPVSPSTPPSSTSSSRSTSPASEPGQQATTATTPPPVGLPFPMEHTRRRCFPSERRSLKFSELLFLFFFP